MGRRFFPRILVVVYLLLSASGVVAQDSLNPFDLIPRLPDSLKEELASRPDSSAPEARSIPVPAPAIPRAEEEPSEGQSLFGDPGLRRLKLGVTLLILVVLAFMVTVLRTLIRKSIGAFLYANMANQVYRDHEGRGFGPFITLYSLFFLNAGVFLFFLTRYFQIEFTSNTLTQLLYCIGGVTALFLLKHLVLSLIGFIFPVHAEIRRYHFIIIVFGIALGIFLVPVNILLAYAPEGLIPVLIYFSLGLMGLAYLYRQFRALLVAGKVLLANLFHFLLYICTVEIAPILFLYQFANNHL